MTSYRVQREFTTWEEVIIEAESEAEAKEKAESDFGKELEWEYTGEYEVTGYWNVLPAEPTWADIGL